MKPDAHSDPSLLACANRTAAAAALDPAGTSAPARAPEVIDPDAFPCPEGGTLGL